MLKTTRRKFLKDSLVAGTALAVCGTKSYARAVGANNRQGRDREARLGQENGQLAANRGIAALGSAGVAIRLVKIVEFGNLRHRSLMEGKVVVDNNNLPAGLENALELTKEDELLVVTP